MKDAVEKLVQLRQLLKIEREEDYNQYKEHFSRNNINYRKTSGVTWYPVVITGTEIGYGEYLNIDIERTTNLNEPHLFSGGKSAALFSNNYPDEAPIQGTVKVVNANKIRLSLTTDELPDWCDDGKLGINLLFDEASYKEMDSALEKVIHADNNRLAQLRDILYKKITPQFDTTVVALPATGLNVSQQEAVQKIVSAKDVAIIHGPPGTGKTTTLVQAIIQTLQKEQQVLVCSSSNTAVDLLTEKLAAEGLSVLRLGNPARISEEVMKNTLDAKLMTHPSYKEIKKYRKTADEYFRMAGKYKRKFGKEEREQRQLLYQEAKKIIKEAQNLEEYIVNDLFDTAQVIACTPVVSAGRIMRSRRFSTVFIDEAAQALEPMCWIPITRSNRVIFAGDHFQLPPTVKSKKAEEGGLSQTLFEHCITIPDIAVMLNVQYRMNEAIMRFSGKKFYENKLRAYDPIKEQVLNAQPQYELLCTPITFVDTAGCGYTEQLNPETLSISNTEEAQLLLKHLKRLLQQYESVEAGKVHSLSIGIISPYKEQVQYLTQQVEADEVLKLYRSCIAVKTVDGFQGQEKDVIYISLVRSNENQEIGFLNDIRRMNVAITRARKKLVLVGDSATLGNHSFYKEFLNYTEQINAYKSAWEFVAE